MKEELIFDDERLVYLLPQNEKTPNIDTFKPYVLFKRDKEYQIEIFPAMNRKPLREYYGDYYEIIYDATKTSEEQLITQKVNYVKTTVGEVKKHFEQLALHNHKVYTRIRKR